MSWKIIIENIEADKKLLENTDTDYHHLITGDNASAQLLIDINDLMFHKWKANIKREWVKEV